MNLLAHAYLAGPSAEAQVGQIAADFLPAREIDGLPPAVRAAVRAHQQIDVFTDSHPVALRSKQRFSPPYRRYAAVLVDVFYDHFLAAGWRRHGSGGDLTAFTGEVYENLYRHEALLPERLRRILPRMARQDWLASYATGDGVERALQGLSRRLSRANPLASAGERLLDHYCEFRGDFEEFFPELRHFATELGGPARDGSNP